ncbi:MAG TPA: FeoB small GTPase domain-containing protein, partial [Geobacteraceae bacterium]|nr:FeoB small GTPase domain-containing protein [Geobacteraceae bacterium]
MAFFKKRPSCHSTGSAPQAGGKKVALVGNPNVGKSVLFNALTGAYVTVSNYPGTSVEVARGSAVIDGVTCEIIDTPGMYSILPITE